MKTVYRVNETQDFENIVFENKNKAYGAYQLRKNYPKNMNRALSIALVCVCLALISPVIYGELMPKDAALTFSEPHTMSDIPLPPPANPKQPEPQMPKLEQPKTKTVAFLTPTPTPDEELPTNEPDVPTITEVSTAVIGSKNSEGEEGNPDMVIDEGQGKENKEVVEIDNEEDKIFTFVEQLPHYQGGMAELMKYLSRNLRYPRQAQQNEIEGKVYVSFVVGKDSNIYDVKVLKGIGYGCDEEAVRVVSAMTGWVAGKQSGKTVAVRYNLPISFRLAQ